VSPVFRSIADPKVVAGEGNNIQRRDGETAFAQSGTFHQTFANKSRTAFWILISYQIDGAAGKFSPYRLEVT